MTNTQTIANYRGMSDFWIAVVEHDPGALATYRQMTKDATPQQRSELVDMYDEIADAMIFGKAAAESPA